MSRHDPAWLDAQYDNRARIPEHPAIFDRWRRDSARARRERSCRLDVRYGSGPNESLDVFVSPWRDAPVLVFLHGGYWRALDKSDHSFVAPAFVDAGAMVVVPNYALCPTVSMRTIALQAVRALAWVWRHASLYGADPARIVVAGHSAGGHLAAMATCCDWRRLGADLPRDLVHGALAISGLFDLEPLRRAPSLQRDLRLDTIDARALSPSRFPPPLGHRLYTVVGADESEEFLRQNELLRHAWGQTIVPVCETVPGRHHLDVIDALLQPESRLHRLALDLLGL